MVTLAYKGFLDRVEKLVRDSSLTESQFIEEVNRAAFIAVIGSLGGLAVAQLELGAIGTILRIFMASFISLWGFGWYS